MTILRHFNPDAAIEVHTDASGDDPGIVLAQQGHDYPMEHAVSYVSRAHGKVERNYLTTQKDCPAIIWAVGKFRSYSYGRPSDIVNGHHSLCWLTSLKDTSGRLE